MELELRTGSISRWTAQARLGCAMALVLLCAGEAHAAGTVAGTLIPNIAVIDYVYGGAPARQIAAAVPISVARVLSVRTTWQDSTPAAVSSPDTARALSFLVTNTGNGTDTFVLTRDNAVAGDQFDPVNSPSGGIWIESGAQPGFQATGPNADTAYVAGANDLVLAADASRIVYLASSIPAGLAIGAAGKASLQVRAALAPPATPPGTQVALQGATSVIAGAGGGASFATGSYLVSNVAVGILKSVVSAVDSAGGTRVMPGTVLTYRLQVSASGSGTATNIAVTDPLPATLTYVPGSLTVDGVPRTDAADGDDTSVSGNTVRTVLPSLAAPQSRAIEFKATVN